MDDILLTGSNPNEVHHLKTFLHKEFTIKDLGLLHYFLGLEASYLTEGVVLSQRKFTQELLVESNMLQAKPASTPLPLNLKLTADQGTLLTDPTPYRILIGKLNFLTHTRPHLSFAV